MATMNDRAAQARDPVLMHHAAIVDAAQRMRPLSHSTLALVELCAKNNTDLAAFGKVIAQDQVLAATVLREANSAASAASEPISSIEQAFVRLGLGRVLTVAIRASVFDQIGVAVPEYGLAQGDLALDSVVGSIAAEIVHERARVPLPSALPTAALVRDIGLLVLANSSTGPTVTCSGSRGRAASRSPTASAWSSTPTTPKSARCCAVPGMAVLRHPPARGAVPPRPGGL